MAVGILACIVARLMMTVLADASGQAGERAIVKAKAALRQLEPAGGAWTGTVEDELRVLFRIFNSCFAARSAGQEGLGLFGRSEQIPGYLYCVGLRQPLLHVSCLANEKCQVNSNTRAPDLRHPRLIMFSLR